MVLDRFCDILSHCQLLFQLIFKQLKYEEGVESTYHLHLGLRNTEFQSDRWHLHVFTLYNVCPVHRGVFTTCICIA